MLKKTKIVCTLGPSSNTPEIIEKMIKAGMNVARFNFSHGSHEETQTAHRHGRCLRNWSILLHCSSTRRPGNPFGPNLRMVRSRWK